MPWFRLDDSFHSHPKVIAAGNEAIGLYVRCGTYAAQHLTDGFIPEHVALLYGSAALADTLVRTKLWRRTRGGWLMPDYLEYNPSRESVDNQRKSNAERQSRWRERQSRRPRNAVTNAVTNSAPSHPIPTTPQPPEPDGSGGQPAEPEHHGQHKHCRACGTSPRGPAPPPPPTPAERHPSARPVAEVTGANGSRPAGPGAVAAIAAQARAAITRESP